MMKPRRSAFVLIPAALCVAACATTTARQAEVATAPPVSIEVPAIARPSGESAAWWFRAGAAQAANAGAHTAKARNVILFVGDGMSLATVAAARILAGQRAGMPGEEHRLAWEYFPATAFSRTYNVDSQIPDSAGTMSAMATGVKTRAGVISVGPDVASGACTDALRAPMLSLWELAASSGMATGVVTTTRATHATPAATFSHSSNRDWEYDTALPATAVGCHDIARQMIESPFGTGPDVLLGGGRSQFMTLEQADPEYPQKHGLRGDGRDLVASWQKRHVRSAYVWNAKQLAQAPADAPLLGLFEPSHMQFEHDRPQDAAGEPSLAEMTRAALARLSRNAHGYVLLVEGGRIDHAHHLGNAYRALTDTVAMSDAVQAAVEMTSADDTLIVVTADHSHSMSFSGYPVRGNPILGKVRDAENADKLALDGLGLPYTTLGYANGPGYVGASAQQPEGVKRYPHDGKGFKPAAHGRPDLSNINTEAPDYMQEATVPFANESHSGEDVGIWARGPGSDAIRGSVEQNAIFHFMLQATPRLRAALCRHQRCASGGIPVDLPDPRDYQTPR